MRRAVSRPSRLVCAVCFLPLAAAQEDDRPFHGVFSTDAHPVDGCRIVRAGGVISGAYMGHGRFGLDFEMGVLRLDGVLRTIALAQGFNAVVGARIQVSHAGDAVFETGQDWRTGDDRFDGAGSSVAVGYGTPVEVMCG